jgi:hypothetical protein
MFCSFNWWPDYYLWGDFYQRELPLEFLDEFYTEDDPEPVWFWEDIFNQELNILKTERDFWEAIDFYSTRAWLWHAQQEIHVHDQIKHGIIQFSAVAQKLAEEAVRRFSISSLECWYKTFETIRT